MHDTYQDIENIVAGWQTALGQPFISEIGNYATIISLLFQAGGLARMSGGTLATALELYDIHPNEATMDDRMRVLTYAGWFAFSHARLNDALGMFNRAHHLLKYKEVSESPQAGLLLSFLGFVMHLQGKPMLAKRYILQAIEHCDRKNFAFGMCNAYTQLAIVEFREENYLEAEEITENVLTIIRRNRFEFGVIWVEPLLGIIRHMLGGYGSAQALWRRTLSTKPEFFASESILMVIIGIALILEHREERELAIETLAIVLHHPRNDVHSQLIARHVMEIFRKRYPKEQIEAVMEQAKHGELSNNYLSSNFRIDQVLLDRLLVILDEIAPAI